MPVKHKLPKLENPKKNAENKHFGSSYADLTSVLEAVQPVFALGFTVNQTVVDDSEGWGVSGERAFVTTVRDPDGVIIKQVAFPFLPAADYHKLGSALTYSRRYGLCLAFNLVGEDDDDGNLAAGSKPKTPKPAPRRRQRKTTK